MSTDRVPSELLKLIDPERDVEGYRNLVCHHYGSCLDDAVENQWTSWTCALCPLFEDAPRLRAVDYAVNDRM